MSTRTKPPSRTQSTIALKPQEFEAPGLESGELSAAVAGDPLPLPAAAVTEGEREDGV
jgi:hypothetical protein